MKKMDTSIVSSCCIIALSNTFWSHVNTAVVGSPILTQSGYVTESTAQYLNDIFAAFVINPRQIAFNLGLSLPAGSIPVLATEVARE
ncbi:MAG: hypothetical protein WB611_21995 [Stellaceae bacterium]